LRCIFDRAPKTDVYCKASLITVKGSSKIIPRGEFEGNQASLLMLEKFKILFFYVDGKQKSDVYCRASLIAVSAG
jgi:hypothetical protein